MEDLWRENRLLRSLSLEGQTLLTESAVQQTLKLRTVLFAEYESPSFAYLPLGGVASVVAITAAGETAEVGFTGCEGLVGAYHLLGPAKVPTRCFVQIEGEFLRLPFAGVRKAYEASAEVRGRIHEFLQADSLCVSQMAGCHQVHKQEERLARWLLMAHDRHRGKTLPLTHEILAEMIGARRTTVTDLTGKFRHNGLLSYKRGQVLIEDRHGLERLACDCYGIARGLFDGLYQAV